jgi:hypothetical protein
MHGHHSLYALVVLRKIVGFLLTGFSLIGRLVKIKVATEN